MIEQPQEMSPDVKERLDKFMKGYEALVKEHQIDFAAYPVYMPDGQGGFRTVMQNSPVDIKNQPQRSPEEFVTAKGKE
jgi:hypothetical protein